MQEAKTHRQELERIYGAMVTAETDAAKKLDDLEDKRRQLLKARNERRQNCHEAKWSSCRFSTPSAAMKIDQIWLPKLTIYYNFSDVARFDRCTNCHQAHGQDGARLGRRAALSPAARRRRLRWPRRPSRRPACKTSRQTPRPAEALTPDVLKEIYGLQIGRRTACSTPTMPWSAWSRPSRSAAKARLEVGDVIAEVGDAKVLEQEQIVYNYLLETAHWGQPLELTVRRGAAASLCQPSAARSVRRLAQPAQDGRRRLHDLPRRAGERARRSNGRRTRRTIRSRPIAGSASTAGSTTTTGSFRCTPSGSPRACA